MSTPRHSLVLRLVPVSLIALGCGAETYQERIVGNAIPLFQYERELDTNLGAEWHKGEVRLRLPAGFKEIPGPKKDEVDRRLPPGLAGITTGVLGGFRGRTQALSSGGQSVETPIHALVLSNRALLAAREPETKPQDFDRLILNVVSRAAGGGSVQPSILKPISIGGTGFEPSLRYETASFETAGGVRSGDVPMRYEVYLRREPQARGTALQVALVFIVPKDVVRSGPLRKQIELSLQTLRIEGRSASAPSPSGPSPSSTGSPGF